MSNKKKGTERWPTAQTTGHGQGENEIIPVDLEALRRQQRNKEMTGDTGQALVNKFKQWVYDRTKRKTDDE